MLGMTTSTGVPVKLTAGNWIAIVAIIVSVLGAAITAHVNVMTQISGIATDVAAMRIQQQNQMDSIERRLGRIEERTMGVTEPRP